MKFCKLTYKFCQMKTTGIIMLILAAVLFATNPDKDDFKEYMAAKIKEEIVKETRDKGEVAGIFKPFAEGLAELGGALGTTFTERDNYYLFSIYTFQLPSNPDEKPVKFLGIAKQFIELDNE